MDIILLKDYTIAQGRLFPKGSTLSCDRKTYEKLLAEGICDAIPGEKKIKKSKKKTETDGNNNSSKD